MGFHVSAKDKEKGSRENLEEIIASLSVSKDIC